MALIVPNEGEIEMLTRILDTDVFLKLFKEPTTIDETTVVGDFVEPVAGGIGPGNGYAIINLASGDWTIVTGGDGKAVATQTQKTFSFTAGLVSVYGYFITDLAGTVCLWAEVFTDGPYVLPAAGGEIRVLPRVKLH